MVHFMALDRGGPKRLEWVTRRRSALVAAADVLVVATIATVLVVAGLVFIRQRAYDDAAADIAAWARDQGADRVAWPADAREAVPALLDGGVIPVLLDEPVPPQQYAVARTDVVVTKVGAPSPAYVVESHRTGDLIAHRVDLDEAGSVPLEVGDTISEEISRPYRYAPLRPSASLPPGEVLERELSLEPGRYEVRVEAYVGIEAEAPVAALLVVLAPAGGDFLADGGRVDRVVHEPLVVELTVPDGLGPEAVLGIGPFGEPGTPTVFVHGWSISRVADG